MPNITTNHAITYTNLPFFPKIPRKLTKPTADKRDITRNCISLMGALKESDVWQTSRFSFQIAFCLQVKKGEFNECEIRGSHKVLLYTPIHFMSSPIQEQSLYHIFSIL